MQAFVLNGDYEDAIEFGTTLERDHPGIEIFSHHILDALFALGKTENDFAWTVQPSIIRLDRTSWYHLVTKFSRVFKRAAGTTKRLSEEATCRGLRWLQAPSNPL